MTTGVVVDVLVVLAILGYAVSGYRQGLVTAILSLIGFVGGALAAIVFVPRIAEPLAPGPQRAVVVVVAVLLSAWAGQALGGLLGAALRDRVTLHPARVLDQMLGAVAGMLAVAVVLWFVAGAVQASSAAGLSRAVAGSRVLGAVDHAVPDRFSGLAEDFRTSVSGGAFPRVFSGVTPDGVAPVRPPDPALASDPALKASAKSIVKITGEAPDCRRAQEGSGAVVAPERVVTNAHVVAGVRRPTLQVGGTGRRYRATVVAFDPRRDIAVLAVPGLSAPPLKQGEPLGRGNDAVVAGFPRNGPYTLGAARVRRTLEALGEDIYGERGAMREVYELFAVVEPGNSGGPVLDRQGRMVGIVFARSETDPDTGYALTLKEVEPVIAAGVSATDPVSTQECTPG